MVFKLDPSGNETVLYNFTGGADGGGPSAGVVRDTDGNLYGTTAYGGDLSACGGHACGVVFKLDPTGHETVLYSFTGGDGQTPLADLVRDKNGNLYGTTRDGGAFGYGVVFKVDPTGNETVLYSFTGGADGAHPWAGVVRDENGNLYGTAGGGGAFGHGVVFEVDPTGKETVLYSFTGGTDGGFPYGGLVRDKQGNLYGTTAYGGDQMDPCDGLCGVVFKLDPTGKETVLYSFHGGADGADPMAGLFRDKNGNLYGTASSGGDFSGYCGIFGSCGVVFKITACHTALCQGQ